MSTAKRKSLLSTKGDDFEEDLLDSDESSVGAAGVDESSSEYTGGKSGSSGSDEDDDSELSSDAEKSTARADDDADGEDDDEEEVDTSNGSVNSRFYTSLELKHANKYAIVDGRVIPNPIPKPAGAPGLEVYISLDDARCLMSGGNYYSNATGKLFNLYIPGSIDPVAKGAQDKVPNLLTVKAQLGTPETPRYEINYPIAWLVLQHLPFKEFLAPPAKWTTVPIVNAKNDEFLAALWEKARSFEEDSYERRDRWFEMYYFRMFIEPSVSIEPVLRQQISSGGPPVTLTCGNWMQQFLYYYKLYYTTCDLKLFDTEPKAAAPRGLMPDFSAEYLLPGDPNTSLRRLYNSYQSIVNNNNNNAAGSDNDATVHSFEALSSQMLTAVPAQIRKINPPQYELESSLVVQATLASAAIGTDSLLVKSISLLNTFTCKLRGDDKVPKHILIVFWDGEFKNSPSFRAMFDCTDPLMPWKKKWERRFAEKEPYPADTSRALVLHITHDRISSPLAEGTREIKQALLVRETKCIVTLSDTDSPKGEIEAVYTQNPFLRQSQCIVVYFTFGDSFTLTQRSVADLFQNTDDEAESVHQQDKTFEFGAKDFRDSVRSVDQASAFSKLNEALLSGAHVPIDALCPSQCEPMVLDRSSPEAIQSAKFMATASVDIKSIDGFKRKAAASLLLLGAEKAWIVQYDSETQSLYEKDLSLLQKQSKKNNDGSAKAEADKEEPEMDTEVVGLNWRVLSDAVCPALARRVACMILPPKTPPASGLGARQTNYSQNSEADSPLSAAPHPYGLIDPSIGMKRQVLCLDILLKDEQRIAGDETTNYGLVYRIGSTVLSLYEDSGSKEYQPNDPFRTSAFTSSLQYLLKFLQETQQKQSDLDVDPSVEFACYITSKNSNSPDYVRLYGKEDLLEKKPAVAAPNAKKSFGLDEGDDEAEEQQYKEELLKEKQEKRLKKEEKQQQRIRGQKNEREQAAERLDKIRSIAEQARQKRIAELLPKRKAELTEQARKRVQVKLRAIQELQSIPPLIKTILAKAYFDDGDEDLESMPHVYQDAKDWRRDVANKNTFPNPRRSSYALAEQLFPPNVVHDLAVRVERANSVGIPLKTNDPMDEFIKSPESVLAREKAIETIVEKYTKIDQVNSQKNKPNLALEEAIAVRQLNFAPFQLDKFIASVTPIVIEQEKQLLLKQKQTALGNASASSSGIENPATELDFDSIVNEFESKSPETNLQLDKRLVTPFFHSLAMELAGFKPKQFTAPEVIEYTNGLISNVREWLLDSEKTLPLLSKYELQNVGFIDATNRPGSDALYKLYVDAALGTVRRGWSLPGNLLVLRAIAQLYRVRVVVLYRTSDDQSDLISDAGLAKKGLVCGEIVPLDEIGLRPIAWYRTIYVSALLSKAPSTFPIFRSGNGNTVPLAWMHMRCLLPLESYSFSHIREVAIKTDRASILAEATRLASKEAQVAFDSSIREQSKNGTAFNANEVITQLSGKSKDADQRDLAQLVRVYGPDVAAEEIVGDDDADGGDTNAKKDAAGSKRPAIRLEVYLQNPRFIFEEDESVRVGTSAERRGINVTYMYNNRTPDSFARKEGLQDIMVKVDDPYGYLVKAGIRYIRARVRLAKTKPVTLNAVVAYHNKKTNSVEILRDETKNDVIRYIPKKLKPKQMQATLERVASFGLLAAGVAANGLPIETVAMPLPNDSIYRGTVAYPCIAEFCLPKPYRNPTEYFERIAALSDFYDSTYLYDSENQLSPPPVAPVPMEKDEKPVIAPVLSPAVSVILSAGKGDATPPPPRIVASPASPSIPPPSPSSKKPSGLAAALKTFGNRK